MKTVKRSKQKPATKPPVVASSKGKPAIKAPKPASRTSAMVEAKVLKTPVSRDPVPRSKKKPVKPSPPLKKKAAAPVAKKRAPQHDSAYYAEIGRRGGSSLVRKRGTEFFAEIASRSHPRAVYNGGRPKGTTKEAKRLQVAHLDAVVMKLAAKKVK